MPHKKKLQFKKQSNIKVFCSTLSTGFLISCFVLLFFSMNFVWTHPQFQIWGSSMQPTIAGTGFSCFVAPNAQIARGDIIVADNKSDTTLPLIKRAIAFGGEKFGFFYHAATLSTPAHYQIVLQTTQDDQPHFLIENYLYDNEGHLLQDNVHTYSKFMHNPRITPYLEIGTFEGQNINLYTVPQGQIFFLGDNRQDSSDCSNLGCFAMSDIEGKVVCVYPSTVPILLVALTQILGF